MPFEVVATPKGFPLTETIDVFKFSGEADATDVVHGGVETAGCGMARWAAEAGLAGVTVRCTAENAGPADQAALAVMNVAAAMLNALVGRIAGS